MQFGVARAGVVARMSAELAPLGLGALGLDAIAALVLPDEAVAMRRTERWTILRRVLSLLAQERAVIV